MFVKAVLIRILVPILAILALTGAAQAADTYEVDPVHSSIVFRIMHNNVSFIYGRFNEFDGRIIVDEADPANSSVTFTVETASVDTINSRRDDHLRSGDFFEAEGFPVITFVSREVRPLADDRFEVVGELNLRGVAVPLTTEVQLTGRGENRDGNPLLGFETTFTVDRTAFGMDPSPSLGSEVQVTVSAQAGMIQPEPAVAAE